MIFWLVLKLEISYKSYNILKDFGFFLEDFLKNVFFAWWSIWVSIILFLCKSQKATVWNSPCFFRFPVSVFAQYAIDSKGIARARARARTHSRTSEPVGPVVVLLPFLSFCPGFGGFSNCLNLRGCSNGLLSLHDRAGPGRQPRSDPSYFSPPPPPPWLDPPYLISAQVLDLVTSQVLGIFRSQNFWAFVLSFFEVVSSTRFLESRETFQLKPSSRRRKWFLSSRAHAFSALIINQISWCVFVVYRTSSDLWGTWCRRVVSASEVRWMPGFWGQEPHGGHE